MLKAIVDYKCCVYAIELNQNFTIHFIPDGKEYVKILVHLKRSNGTTSENPIDVRSWINSYRFHEIYNLRIRENAYGVYPINIGRLIWDYFYNHYQTIAE